MAICNNLEQAAHNEKVCSYLSKKNEFSDWVITTSFYSALHYVRHLIIPYKHYTINSGEKEFKNFESMFSELKRDAEGRHGFQNRIVYEKFHSIRFEYQKLYELSNEARYGNYKYGHEDAVSAQKYLKKIKDFCINKE